MSAPEHTSPSWDYIAGFVDGEGCIRRVGRGCRVTIGQNSRHVLDAIQSVFTSVGVISYIYSRPAKPPKQPNVSHVLVVTDRRFVVAVCERLLPLLIVKRADALAMLEWIHKHPRKANMDPVNEDRLRELHADGYTQGAIAKLMRYGAASIIRAAKDHGLRFYCGGKTVNGKRIPKRTREEHMAAREAKERKLCPGCGVKIYIASKRCKSCAIKHRHQEAEQSFRLSSTKPAASAASQ